MLVSFGTDNFSLNNYEESTMSDIMFGSTDVQCRTMSDVGRLFTVLYEKTCAPHVSSICSK